MLQRAYWIEDSQLAIADYIALYVPASPASRDKLEALGAAKGSHSGCTLPVVHHHEERR